MSRFDELMEALTKSITAQSVPPPKIEVPSDIYKVPNESPTIPEVGKDLQKGLVTSAQYQNQQYLEARNKSLEDTLNRIRADQTINWNKYIPRREASEAVSGVSHPESLRLSRLADALNNRYYRTPYRHAVSMAGYGGTIIGSAEPGQVGEQYKMPIETEEMRTMQRARQGEQAVQTAEIQRQQAAKNLQLDQDKELAIEMLRRSGKYKEHELELIKQGWMFSKEYEEMVRAIAFERSQHTWRYIFDRLKIPIQQATIVANLALPGGNQVLANLFAAAAFNQPAPSMQQSAQLRGLSEAMAAAGSDPGAQQYAAAQFIIDMGFHTFNGLFGRIVPNVRETYNDLIRPLFSGTL